MQSGETGRIVLLGNLRFEHGETVVTRFRSQKFGTLLAYLALFPRRVHTREELADLLWPDAELEVGRTNLRTALASLRRQLEPAGTPPGSVLVTDGRTTVQLANVETDVAKFDRLCGLAARASTSAEDRVRLLTEAVALYGGPLIPGCYETWALTERDRLAGAYLAALSGLSEYHEARGEWSEALDFARRAVAVDPLSEDAQADVLRLLTASGQTAAALRYWQDLEKLFEKELGMPPSPELRELFTQASKDRKPRAARSAPIVTSIVQPSPALAEPEPAKPSPVHLPLTLTRFFGREAEIARLRELVETDGMRLVTLTGPGGSGKTRVAIEAARALAHRFPGGVYFIPLADLHDPELWFDFVADAAGLTRTPGSSSRDVIAEAFDRADGPVLLVLDNFEHIAEQTAAHVPFLMTRVPGLTCLVTSRQRLLLEGEQEAPVAPLAVPATGRNSRKAAGTATDDVSPEWLLQFPAVQLFVNRAQAARPDFQLNARNALAVAQLCEKLEGIPLALELAAAWAQTLSPAQMLVRMARRFDLLVARRRDVTERHKTLRSTIAWSYHSLPADVQQFFAQLSVFQGGWTLEAAEAVCLGGDPFGYLAELQERSLITAQDDGDGIRFRMLETLREFADDQLTDELRRSLRERHAEYFVQLAETTEGHLLGGVEEAEWLARLALDMDNLRAVLERSGEGDVRAGMGLRLSGAIARFWRLRGSIREGLDRFKKVLDQAENKGRTEARARALRGAGMLATAIAEYRYARDANMEAIAIFREIGDQVGEGRVCSDLGNIGYYQSDFDSARKWYTEGLAIARSRNDLSTLGRLLSNLGMIVQGQGDHDAALALYSEARDVFVRIGDQQGVANCMMNVGTVHIGLKEDDKAQIEFERCLVLAKEMGDRTLIAICTHNLGAVARDHGDLIRGKDLLEQAMGMWQELEDLHGESAATDEFGLLARQQGDFDAAAALHAKALTLRMEIDDKRGAAESLRSLAALALDRKKPEEAAYFLGASDAVLLPLGTPMSPFQRSEYEQCVKDTRRILGDERFAEANAAGRTRSLEHIVRDLNAGIDPLAAPRSEPSSANPIMTPAEV